jgi:hypothetical protein
MHKPYRRIKKGRGKGPRPFLQHKLLLNFALKQNRDDEAVKR